MFDMPLEIIAHLSEKIIILATVFILSFELQ